MHLIPIALTAITIAKLGVVILRVVITGPRVGPLNLVVVDEILDCFRQCIVLIKVGEVLDDVGG